MSNFSDKAWAIIDEASTDSFLLAAAKSQLYPHLWVRDFCISSLGILAAARKDSDLELIQNNLEYIFSYQNEFGRIPLKIDIKEKKPVLENSAGVDGNLWVILVAAFLQLKTKKTTSFKEQALKALHWAEHLDVNGNLLLETPEASDWADMMPAHHNVLNVNVLYYAALKAAGIIAPEKKELFSTKAEKVKKRLNALFWLETSNSHQDRVQWLNQLEEFDPEWSLTGLEIANLGARPFFLPYVGFRCFGTYFDNPANMLAILFSIADQKQTEKILNFTKATGLSSETIYPPLHPGDKDWRGYFKWRNLNLPHQYQNGGKWPFIGAFHVAALVKAERFSEAETMLENLKLLCEQNFPEWCHGLSSQSMGEIKQTWSAAGYLWAKECVDRKSVPLLGELL